MVSSICRLALEWYNTHTDYDSSRAHAPSVNTSLPPPPPPMSARKKAAVILFTIGGTIVYIINITHQYIYIVPRPHPYGHETNNTSVTRKCVYTYTLPKCKKGVARLRSSWAASCSTMYMYEDARQSPSFERYRYEKKASESQHQLLVLILLLDCGYCSAQPTCMSKISEAR